METIVTIPEPIVTAADQLAAELEISRSELYTIALDAFIKARQSSEITRALDEIYAAESSELDPVIWQMQLASLPEAEW
jgi:hypothetical protein